MTTKTTALLAGRNTSATLKLDGAIRHSLRIAGNWGNPVPVAVELSTRGFDNDPRITTLLTRNKTFDLPNGTTLAAHLAKRAAARGGF
jgi:hypothetical protein